MLGLELVFYINFGIVLGRLKFCFDILFLTSLYALALYDLTPWWEGISFVSSRTGTFLILFAFILFRKYLHWQQCCSKLKRFNFGGASEISNNLITIFFVDRRYLCKYKNYFTLKLHGKTVQSELFNHSLHTVIN